MHQREQERLEQYQTEEIARRLRAYRSDDSQPSWYHSSSGINHNHNHTPIPVQIERMEDGRTTIHISPETYGGDEDDYDDSSGLVLTTFPPPTLTEDTLMVKFGPGMQAYLEYLHNDEDEDHHEGQETTMSPQTSNNDSKGSPIAVDYRTMIQDCYV